MERRRNAAALNTEEVGLRNGYAADSIGQALAAQIKIGVLSGLVDEQSPLVRVHDGRREDVLKALTAVDVGVQDIGRKVVLVFPPEESGFAVVIGLIREPSLPRGRGVDIRVDDEHVMISAREQITLSCGDASVTLTRAGKVMIRGKYVVSRSSGVNRIKGACIELN